MGRLDKAKALPKISTPASDSQINYSIANQNTLIDESFGALAKKNNGLGPFTTLNVGGPSFSELAAIGSLGALKPNNSYFKTAAAIKAKPTETSATANQTAAEIGNSLQGNTDHKVKLVSIIDGRTVMFDVMPEVAETRSAEYEAVSAAQMPGEFQKYKGTKSTTWQVNATFICRNSVEATQQYLYLNLLRAWVMPYFGNLPVPERDRLGAPPPVLNFSGWRGVVGEVPVVVTSLNWSWPKDCDWIPTEILDENRHKVPFPTVMNIQISLVESFSATQFNAFDLGAFRDGKMIGAYGGKAKIESPAEGKMTSKPVVPTVVPSATTVIPQPPSEMPRVSVVAEAQTAKLEVPPTSAVPK